MPSEADFRDEKIGPLLDKYLHGRADIPTEHRMRIMRLIENMTLGRNAVGYLTESMHGAGSPQAQRIQIYRYMQLEFKQKLAQRLAGIDLSESVRTDLNNLVDSYFARVFERDGVD
jgi:4-hydroxybutyryl-CoA dehydratase/vinylacetyl-CoA-Delta-isomerase